EQGGTWPVSAVNSRAVICQPQHPARASARLHGKRRARRVGQSGLRHGRMRQMNMSIFKSVPRIAFALLLAVNLVGLGACTPGKRITKANVDEVAEGMSKKQVESILGPPTSINNEDLIIMKKTTYFYRQGKDTVTIVFKDDKVQSKDSTLSY